MGQIGVVEEQEELEELEEVGSGHDRYDENDENDENEFELEQAQVEVQEQLTKLKRDQESVSAEKHCVRMMRIGSEYSARRSAQAHELGS
jgi:hypothetical protein